MKGKVFVGFLFLLASCLDTDITTPYEQLQRDIKKIDQYLLDNGITDVIRDGSGVRIVIHELGIDGLPPDFYNELEVDYIGKYLKNGNVFDEGTIYKSLGDLIDGWKIALPLLPEGTKADLYIPSLWAYGNANLIFNVDLVNVDLTDAQNTKLNSDTLAIDAELAEFNVNAIKEPGGLRYVMTNEGIGEMPTLYSQVKVAFRGLLLSDSSEFVNQVIEPTVDFSSRVANYPNGVMIALQKMKKGGKATLFTPSRFAQSKYGIIIPTNQNIVFEVELLDIIE